jgi:hypothetical protein
MRSSRGQDIAARCYGPIRQVSTGELVSGGGFGGRELYSDHDKAVFDATRPLVFNAIPDLGTARPDFLYRALMVEFLSITRELRRDEAPFWSEFAARPGGSSGPCLMRPWRESEISRRFSSNGPHARRICQVGERA